MVKILMIILIFPNETIIFKNLKNVITKQNLNKNMFPQKNINRQLIKCKYVLKKKILPNFKKQYDEILYDNDIKMDSLINVSDMTLEEFLKLASKIFKVNKEFVYISIIFINEYLIKNLYNRNIDKKKIDSDIILKITKNIIIQIFIHYLLKFLYEQINL